MLKRNIAILIAGGLLSAQVGLAAADQGTFPSNDTEVIWKLLPAQVEYFKQRAASIQKEGVVLRGDSVPPSADDLYGKMLPAQAKYFEQGAARNQTATSGDAFKTEKIDASTKYVTVQHFSTVKFVNDKGQSFIWTSDTLGEVGVRLKTIAPAGFEAGDTTIYVRHPAAHIPG
jgi:hypothetical protein